MKPVSLAKPKGKIDDGPRLALYRHRIVRPRIGTIRLYVSAKSAMNGFDSVHNPFDDDRVEAWYPLAGWRVIARRDA